MKKIKLLIIGILLLMSCGVSLSADKPVSQLTEATTIAADDLLMISYYNAGQYYSRKVLFSTLQSDVMAFTAASALPLGTSQTHDGKIIFRSGTALNDYLFTIQASNFGANLTWTLPTAAPGGANYLLNVDADGTMGYTDPASIVGNVAVDAIWDNSGDLAIGTGANTAAKLAIGTPYQIPHVKSDASTLEYTSTLGAALTPLAAGFFTDLTVTNAIAGAVTGNAGTATALAANPTDCAALGVATAIDASGNLTCGYAIGTNIQAYDAELGILAGLNFADASLIQLTSANSAAVLTSGGNDYFLKSATDNSALMFATPAEVRTALGLVVGTNVQAYNSNLTGINQALTTTSTPTFAGITISKSSGVAGTSFLYEKNSTDTNGVGWMGPDSRSANLYLKFPDADPTEGQVLTFSAPADGVSTGSWAANGSGSGDFKADGSVPMTAAIVPNAANTVAIGSTSAEWADIYLGDGAVIYGQNDQSNTITSSATGWTFAKPFTVADVTNDNFIKITNNTSRAATASVNELYPEGNVWKANQNGTEYSVAIGPAAEQISFSGTLTNGKVCTYATGGAISCNSDTSGTGDVTAAGDCASGDCYDGSSDGGTYVRLYDGTSAYSAIVAGVRKFTMSSSVADSEDLAITLGNNDNTVTFSSSTGVTTASLSALNLVTTGTISGKIPMISKSGNYTLGTDNAQEAYGYIVWLTGDGTVLTLPAVAAGMSVCVYSADSYDKVVNPNDNDGIRNGTTARSTDGNHITSGATDQASYVCLVADSADGWTVLGKAGTWTNQ